MDGATHIVICDDCIRAEETMGILEEVGQFAYEVLAGTEGK